MGGRQDRLPGRPPREIRGELHHQEPAGEDARLAAQIRDRWPHISGQRRGADPLLIRHAAEDGQPAVRCVRAPKRDPAQVCTPDGMCAINKLRYFGGFQVGSILFPAQLHT